MQKSVNERVKFLFEESSLSKNAFASRTKLTPTTLDNIITGKNIPTKRTLLNIANTYGASESWMIEGRGEPYINGQIHIPDNSRDKQANNSESLIKSLQDQIKFLQEDLNIWRETARNLSAHLGKLNPSDEPAGLAIAYLASDVDAA